MDTKMMKMSSEPRDRLSELPDSLIFNIFEFLPMNDVFTTQFLSHRWENLWTITPYLCFDSSSKRFDDFQKFVNHILLCWRGKRIQKFEVKSETLDKSLFNDLDVWVRFAVDNGVEDLRTSFRQVVSVPNDDDYFRVPNCLYSCSSLQKLSIFVSTMYINGNVVQWNRLKNLQIQCFRITQHAIDLILSKCLVLEVFKLTFGYKDYNLSLSFRSASLKELYVHKNRVNFCIPMDTELKIWTPNLERLTVIGASYNNCLLMDVSSLIHANLMFNKIEHLEEILGKILPAIRHVEGLTLSGCCIQVLGSTTSNTLFSPFPNVVFLSLNGSFEEHEQMVGFLECFPKLKTLVVQETRFADPKSKKKFKPKPSKSFLAELRTVKVSWTAHDFSIFPLIKTLLKYACKLEKMVFHAKETEPPFDSSDSLLSESQLKLLRMRRSSPNAKVIFHED